MNNRLLLLTGALVAIALCLVLGAFGDFGDSTKAEMAKNIATDSSEKSPQSEQIKPAATAPLVEPALRATQPSDEPTVIKAKSPQAPSLSAQYQAIEAQFAEQDYHQVLSFHNLVSLCKGVPKDSEALYLWQLKHNDASDLDAKWMARQSIACKDVPEHGYDQLAALYRQAIKSGEKTAKLALASLMPFDSKEKFELLSQSAVFADEAIAVLAEKALVATEYQSAEQRLFWLSLCRHCFGEQNYVNGEDIGAIDNITAEVKAQLDSGQIEQIEQKLAQWQQASEAQRLALLL